MQRLDIVVSRQLISLALLAALTACGGGGGGSSNPPEPPVVVPSVVTLTVPATAQADATVNFTSSAATTVGLRYAWDFGDGATSTQASPTHSYAQAGDFDVKLVVSNEAGQSIEQKTRLSVERTLAYQGSKCSGADGHGWCWVSGANVLLSTVWQGAQTGWKVGEGGEVWTTVDGGLNWAQQVNDIRESLGQVSFADASRGWVLGQAAGYRTDLWTTSDGGKSWQSPGAVPTAADGRNASNNSSGATLSWLGTDKLLVTSYYWPGLSIFSMAQYSTDAGAHWSAISVNTGQAAPGGKRWRFETLKFISSNLSIPQGSLQGSDDGGLTWSTALPFEADRTGRILTPDSNVVLVLSWRGDVGSEFDRRIDVSRDAGASWTRLAAPTIFDLNVIAYRLSGLTPAGLVWVVDGNTLFRSRDFGSTWQPVPWPFENLGGSPERIDGGSAYWLTTNSGRQWVTYDEGGSWEELSKLDSLTGNSANLLHQSGPDQWVADGRYGGVYVSTDRGKTWRVAMAPRTHRAVLGFHAFNAKEMLRADDDSGNGGGGLWRSSDGGVNWQSVFYGSGALQFVSAKTGWMCGSTGIAGSTHDGGQTWTTIADVSGCNIDFASESHGWIYGGPVYGNYVLQESKDGGATWVRVGSVSGSGDVLALRALSDAEILVLRNSGVWLSTDAGLTWRETLHVEQAGFTTLLKAGSRDVWAAGKADQVWHSTDGGATWARVPLPGSAGLAIKAGYFLDAQRGWLDSGRPGELLRTVDGGKTWTSQRTTSSMELSGMQFIDGKTGWFWGPHGLLGTGSGGQ